MLNKIIWEEKKVKINATLQFLNKLVADLRVAHDNIIVLVIIY